MKRPRPTYNRRRMLDDMYRRGWTAVQVARMINRHPSTLSDFFQSNTSSPNLAAAIAAALGYPLSRYMRRAA